MLVMDFPRLWAFGKDTGTFDGIYGFPLWSNLHLWRKSMSCANCQKRRCRQRKNRKYLWHTPAYLVSFLFKIRFFHCGKEWRGACEKFFEKEGIL